MEFFESETAERARLITLLTLDAATVLIVAVLCIRCRCAERWKGVLRGCKSQALLCKKLRELCIGDDDPIVQKKFVENLVQIERTGCTFMAMALFLRLMAIQAPLLRTGTITHNLQPSLDVSNMMSFPLCTLIAIFPQVVAGWNLDLWYIVMQSLCIFPLFFTREEDVLNVSLITAFPRLLCGLGARSGFLPILGNVMNCAAATYLSEEGNLLAFTAEACMVFSGFLSIRYMLHQNVVMTGRLKTRTIDLGAVSQLLLGFCDAVVEIDSSLKLTEDSRQLSTLLLHNQGMTSDGLAGRDFLSFFSTEDRERIKESLSSGSSQTMALNARMMDCLRSNLQMEVVHCHFDNANGQRCCLVGMREFQDFGYSIAPLLEEVAEKDCTLANNLKSSGAGAPSSGLAVDPPETSVPEDATVLFNADTFDILNMGGGFGQLCSRANLPANDLDGVESIFDLSKTTGPSSFGRQLQEAINSWDEAAPKATHLVNVDLLGSIFLDLELLLQKDSGLEHLVGTLQVTRVIPPEVSQLSPSAKLTQSNLARFAGRSVRRSRSGSRCGSHRSRSSKRSDGSERPMHQGSILELRPRLAL